MAAHLMQQRTQLATLGRDGSVSARLEVRAPVSASLMSGAFVLLWSSGYPAARIALDHSSPFTLLELRFGAAGLIFAAIAALDRIAWPRGRAALHTALVGTLQLGLQFGALYWAASQGVNVGLIALVIGTMPIVTALLGRLLFQEAVGRLQWLGFAVGFTGVALAVGETVAAGGGAGPGAYLAVLAGLLAISLGTLYQKRHGSDVDPRSGLALQHLAAAAVLLPFAAREGFRADASAAFFGSLSWVILVNSLTAFALFFLLLRRGVVYQVASLFFLMPPVTALIDYLVLGDALTAQQLGGLALSALGVYLATRPGPPSLPASGSRTVQGKRALLRDGREVTIRPVGPADLGALRRFFRALSPPTSRLRFHAAMKEVPERMLREFSHADQRRHVGFIAEAEAGPSERGPIVVAEARFVRCPGTDAAEFALVVAEGWRRVGLGTSLMRILLQHAGARGVERLCGDALAENEAIRRLLRSLGASPSARAERDATVRLCLDTTDGQAVSTMSASRWRS